MRLLIDTLEHIHEYTGESEALGMLRIMKTYNFVATLTMLSGVLPVLTCLSRALQAKTADFTLVASQLTYVQHFLQQIKERPHDQEYLSTVYDTVTDLAIGVVDLETARKNFNKNVLQPYLEQVSRQISCHFKDTLGLLTAFSIFDPQKCPTDVQQLHKYGTAELEKLLKFYGETSEIEDEGNVFSTPADVDKTESRHEWKAFKLVIFEEKSMSLKELATLFLRSEAKCVTFPNIKILLTIAMVLPVSTATVERSFSDMKQIKDRLRNRLLPASMFKLMIIAIKGPPLHEVDVDAVLALWKAMKPQRLLI